MVGSRLRESIIIAGGDGDFVDGIDLLPLDTGLLILDDLAGTVRLPPSMLRELQNTIPLQGEGVQACSPKSDLS